MKMTISNNEHIKKVLSAIDKDIAENPERLFQVTSGFWNDIQELTKGVEVDLDEELHFEDDEDET